jgi:hypothetical protein
MSRARDLGSSINSTAAGKNLIINGGFDIWQRGTTFAGTTQSVGYTADRWKVPALGQRSYSRQPASLDGFEYCMRIQRDSASTFVSSTGIAETLETSNALLYRGKTLTISFWGRKGENFSASGSLIQVRIDTGTLVNGSKIPGSNLTGQINILSVSQALTTSWQKFTYTTTQVVGSSQNNIAVSLEFIPAGTAGAADYFEVAGVQVEVGSSATPFSRAGGDIQGELAKCQRYYYRDTLEKHLTHVRDSNLWFITKTFPVRMRSVASFSNNLTTKVTPGTFPGTAGQIAIYSNGWAAQNATALSCSSDGGSNDHGSFYIVGFNGTLGQVGSIQSNGISYFEWNAEL